MIGAPLPPPPSLQARIVTAITVVVCVATIIAFAGLIPLGPWADEFYTVAHIRDDGLRFVLDRLLGWSPRPFSELLVYSYGLAVIRWGRPLVTPALVPVWVAFWAIALLPSLLRHRAVVPSLVLGCLLLVGHNVSEVFYWPIAAFAYMPTLAAGVLILTLNWVSLIDRPWSQAAVAAALIIAATSSEVGAMFSATFCILDGIAALVRRDKEKAWLLMPLAVAGAVLFMLAHGRASYATEVFGNPDIAHHPWKALQVGSKSFLTQLIGSDASNASNINFVISACSKILFFIGLCLSLPRLSSQLCLRRQWALMAHAGASTSAALLSLVAAFNQFGVDCCLRHGTMRQGYILLTIAALATTLTAWKQPRDLSTAGNLMLLAAVALPLITTAPKLFADYRHYMQFTETRAALWKSAAQDGQIIIIPQIEPGQIVGGYTVAPGHYSRAKPDTPLLAQWILSFFGKSQAQVEAIQSH